MTRNGATVSTNGGARDPKSISTRHCVGSCCVHYVPDPLREQSLRYTGNGYLRQGYDTGRTR